MFTISLREILGKIDKVLSRFRHQELVVSGIHEKTPNDSVVLWKEVSFLTNNAMLTL